MQQRTDHLVRFAKFLYHCDFGCCYDDEDGSNERLTVTILTVMCDCFVFFAFFSIGYVHDGYFLYF